MTAIAPGSAGVIPVPMPELDWDATSACENVGATPEYAEIVMAPSLIGDVRLARTASTFPWSGFGSGKFCTLVATYVAIEMPPAVRYSTR